MANSYKVIGLMSGTSLDGLDVACCDFELKGRQWVYKIEQAETFHYSAEWKKKLSGISNSSAIDFTKTHVGLGKLYGNLIKEFIAKHGLKPTLIASHGHTVFHQPENGFTAQIGDGSQIAAITGLDTVCDFRSKDLALSGQGAPLVPAGEVYLFNNYRFCLNLGGIANVTVLDKRQSIAFDICAVNMALNYLAAKRGLAYDNNGQLAQKGHVDQQLLAHFNSLAYYSLSYPKSLGREWFEEAILPLLENDSLSIEDKLATYCEHIAMQVKNAIQLFFPETGDQMLITGGGAFNNYLVDSISRHALIDIVIPDEQTVSFKEALVFAFLGVLYIRNEINVFSSVTGSTKDHIGGALYKGQ